MYINECLSLSRLLFKNVCVRVNDDACVCVCVYARACAWVRVY